MNGWTVRCDGFEPTQKGRREALCTLGNGYVATRGAAPEASADGVHYPGTYVAGVYNRLTTELAGRTVEHEDLVSLPNWLPLTVRAPGEDWFDLGSVEVLTYVQELDLAQGLLTRTVRVQDRGRRRTRIECQRFVHMRWPNLGALRMTVIPETWSGQIEIRAAPDGRVANRGVHRYRNLAHQHLVPLESGSAGADTIALKVQTSQSEIRVAQAARTRLCLDGDANAPRGGGARVRRGAARRRREVLAQPAAPRRPAAPPPDRALSGAHAGSGHLPRATHRERGTVRDARYAGRSQACGPPAGRGRRQGVPAMTSCITGSARGPAGAGRCLSSYHNERGIQHAMETMPVVVVMILACDQHVETIRRMLDETSVGSWIALSADQARRAGHLVYAPLWPSSAPHVVFGFGDRPAAERVLAALTEAVHAGSVCPACLAFTWEATQALTPSVARDPVCRGLADRVHAATETYEGATYYFCSADCRDRFVGDPKRYAGGERGV